MIEEGTAKVLKGGEEIAELGPGDFFGEIALLETERRTATVVAATPMRVIVMFQREFRQMESRDARRRRPHPFGDPRAARQLSRSTPPRTAARSTAISRTSVCAVTRTSSLPSSFSHSPTTCPAPRS